MSHLIQTLMVEGVRRCPGVVVATNYDDIGGTNTANADNDFGEHKYAILSTGVLTAFGELSWGVGCGSDHEISFVFSDTSTDPDFLINGYVYILPNGATSTVGGTAVDSFLLTHADDTYLFNFTEEVGACGYIIVVQLSITRSDASADNSDGTLVIDWNPAHPSF